MPDLATVIWVAVAGGLASVLRLSFSRWQGWLPWGVLLANTVASFLLGIWFTGQGWGQPVALIGVCGGLSTFSSVVAASGEYLRNKQWAKASIYAGLSLLIPFTALTAGLIVAPLLLN